MSNLCFGNNFDNSKPAAMPKKMKGENSKAAEARARKADAQAAAQAQKEKEVEDAYWKDDDKHVNKKFQRKAEKEQKRQEELAKKQEKKKLLEEEENNIKGPVNDKGGSGKMTRAQIEANQQRIERERAAEAAGTQRQVSHIEAPLEENPNIRMAEEAQEGVVSARDVEEAISALSVKEKELERHPEKRVKAAYASYEEERLPILKKENPNLRLSQLKQMLKKDWMKSPENPMNQRFQNYDTPK